MSKEAITKVVQRAISDAGFRRQLSTDPAGALRGFDLSADETAALRAGDAGRLSALGVDQRMSKAFVLGGVTVAASRTAGSDLANASSVMASDATAAADARGNALVSDTLSESDAMISDGGASVQGIIPIEPHLRNADADGAASVASGAMSDDPEGFLTTVGTRATGESGATASVISDDTDASLTANAATADVSGSAGDTAFIDDSEAYLTTVGYDASAGSAEAGATWSGDENAGPTSLADDDAAGGSGPSEGGPNISQ